MHLQRFRLASVAFLTALVFVGVIFAGVTMVSRKMEYNWSVNMLKRAAVQASGELEIHPKNPDFGDVLENYPEISIAAFDLRDHLIKSTGSLQLATLTKTDGMSILRGRKIEIQRHAETGIGVVEVAVQWSSREDAINRLDVVLLIITIPLALGAGWITFAASRLTFLPLDDLARQAEKLSDSDLSGRLIHDKNDEFAPFAQQLNRYLDRLQESYQSQEQFVQDAAHELRTPLTIIRGQIETALLRNRSVQEYELTLKTVLAEAERLSRLAELLLVSASGTSEIVPVMNLADGCESVISRWQPRYAAEQVQLEFVPAEVYAAILPDEFTTILDNLLSNALKFAPANSKVSLKVSGSASGGSLIDCLDNGPGVPDTLKKELFERFTRGERSRNRDLGGFGIGLAVCRRLARLRGGDIVLLPSATGAHFQVNFPSVPTSEIPQLGVTIA